MSLRWYNIQSRWSRFRRPIRRQHALDQSNSPSLSSASSPPTSSRRSDSINLSNSSRRGCCQAKSVQLLCKDVKANISLSRKITLSVWSVFGDACHHYYQQTAIQYTIDSCTSNPFSYKKTYFHCFFFFFVDVVVLLGLAAFVVASVLGYYQSLFSMLITVTTLVSISFSGSGVVCSRLM